MITMMMQGGIGNQMFQYATGYAIAKKIGVDLALDISSYKHDSLRRFNLDLFQINNKIVFDSKPTVVESDLTYHPELLDVSDGAVLSGYFQCEKYFQECREELKHIFIPRKSLPFGYEMYSHKIIKSNSVALSIRRGDYLEKQAYHGVLDGSYYREALHHLTQQGGLLDVFIFSDDIPWCKKNLMFPTYFSSMTFIENDMTTPGHVGREDADIFLMKFCRAHILANSTFAWWGAWLSNSNLVIAPEMWYSNGMAHDITPERWIEI